MYVSIYACMLVGTNVSSNEQRLRILSHTQLSSYTILMETNFLNLAFWRLYLGLTFHQMNKGCVFSHTQLSSYTILMETNFLNLAFWRLDLGLTFHQMNKGCVFSHTHSCPHIQFLWRQTF